MDNRNEFFKKWERNQSFIEEFKNLWENYLDKIGTWDNKAFFDSNGTNRQFFISLKQVSELEYSEAQHQGLMKMEIHENAFKDYINNLDVQYNSLKKMYDSIVEKIN
jgi:hypothetical protein